MLRDERFGTPLLRKHFGLSIDHVPDPFVFLVLLRKGRIARTRLLHFFGHSSPPPPSINLSWPSILSRQLQFRLGLLSFCIPWPYFSLGTRLFSRMNNFISRCTILDCLSAWPHRMPLYPHIFCIYLINIIRYLANLFSASSSSVT
ncbi:hypothetical protein M413DRAFT_124735 [Hebeloma cylindrosporum]|nr:hypothetical protein M413DRAFT_124735 [Hebeloma cylindrosporum h7]